MVMVVLAECYMVVVTNFKIDSGGILSDTESRSL
jgi:hypothetical protein